VAGLAAIYTHPALLRGTMNDFMDAPHERTGCVYYIDTVAFAFVEHLRRRPVERMMSVLPGASDSRLSVSTGSMFFSRSADTTEGCV
jgi:hypothetical protein